MKWTTVNVGSVTNAFRGKALLERHGISAHVQRATDANDNNGCGYRLLVNEESERVRQILKKAGISTRDGAAG